MWTKKPPSKPGWYWHRLDREDTPEPVELFECLLESRAHVRTFASLIAGLTKCYRSLTSSRAASGGPSLSSHLNSSDGDDVCCPNCGAIMQRAGSCYVCPVCGATTGCGISLTSSVCRLVLPQLRARRAELLAAMVARSPPANPSAQRRSYLRVAATSSSRALHSRSQQARSFFAGHSRSLFQGAR
jgi:hypothetical protein